jgi:hypothetical protein
VPATDEVGRLQRDNDPECLLFRKFADEGHYGGRQGSRQGTYAATPSGVLLASVNSNDPARIAAMLERALAKWETLSRAERLLAEDPQTHAATLQRPERYYPKDGLVLYVNSRDLPREAAAAGWRANAWNQDYAWFTKEEAKQFLPQPAHVGQKHDLPTPLIERIARCHLVDNVRGQTAAYEAKHIDKARLTVQVTAVEGSVVSLRLEGETRAAAEGSWSVRGLRNPQPTPQKRGFETRLLGRATYDGTKERFVTFELVAVGTRWGGTQFNGRGDDLDPAPLGIVFTLAGNSPWEQVAPAFLRAYGWPR